MLENPTALIPLVSKNHLPHPVSGASRNRSTRFSMVRNISLGMATSAIWKVLYLAWWTTFATTSWRVQILGWFNWAIVCASRSNRCFGPGSEATHPREAP